MGKPVAWLHRSVAPTIGSIFVPGSEARGAVRAAAWASSNVPFAIPNLRIENPAATAHTRIGWFRSVSNIPHAFAIQSFVAELAAAAGKDPQGLSARPDRPDRRIDPRHAQRLVELTASPPSVYPLDTGRLRRVIELAAREAGWGRQLPPGQGLGIAAHYSFVTLRGRGRARSRWTKRARSTIPRIDIALDCGAQVNPDRVRAQIGRRVRHGRRQCARLGEISFKGGRVEQSNFNDYVVARIDGAPRDIRVHLVGSDFDGPLGGVGEPGVPPIAPALANAIFAATGKRIRSLPIGDQLAAKSESQSNATMHPKGLT